MTETAELTASDGGYTDQLGNGAAISGNMVVGGAPQYEPFGNTGNGKAYVFAKPASGWVDMTQTIEMKASAGYACDAMGISMAISGSTVVAGAPSYCAAPLETGAAYVFQSR